MLLIADITMLFHFAVGGFILLGGLLSVKYPRMVLVHLTTVVVSMGVDFFGYTCPITAVERYFRNLGNDASLNGVTFIDQYAGWLSISDEPGSAALTFGILTLVCNVGVYGYVVWKKRQQDETMNEVTVGS